MRRMRNDGGFLLCLIVNLIFNIEWSIPAWICLAVHFIWDLSIWYFIVLIGIWFLYILIVTCVLCWISRCGNEPIMENKNVNPYSKKGNPYQDMDNN